MAASATILGGLLGAGGQVAGGLLGGSSGGQGKSSYYNPYLDYALQASQYAGLDQIGFGNINNVPDPLQQLVERLNAVNMNDKTRKRLLEAIGNIRQDPTLLDDPYGRNFTRDEIFQANKTGAPFGRQVTRSSGGGLSKGEAAGVGAGVGVFGGPIGMAIGAALGGLLGSGNDSAPDGLRVKGIKSLESGLSSLGMNLNDLRDTLARQAEQKAQIQRLNDAGLGRLNEETIINRANAAATAAELTGGAADFARTGQPGAGIGQDLFNRDEKALDDLKSRLGIMANFGGINPAQMFEQLSDAKLDQNIRLIEQQLGMSNALSAALNPGLMAGAAAGSAGSSASLNSASIAAQQAQAANALRAQQQQVSGSSLANGIAGGLGSLGSAIGNVGIMSALGRQGGLGGSSGFSAGLNSSNNGIYDWANGGGQMAPLGGF